MLRIRKIRRYQVAEYPRHQYREKERGAAVRLAKGAAASTALLSLLQGCDALGGGVSGPPPVDPDMMTEADARVIIERVFRDNGVSLSRNQMVTIDVGQEQVELSVDGYDATTQVGYEYITQSDYSEFNQEVVDALEAGQSASAGGPYIEPIREQYQGATAGLEAIVQSFIDHMRGEGVL